tara:strand:+ start:46706 stop:47725 length:1020 start_codon:yes stop_codon:yes gene_type:complete
MDFIIPQEYTIQQFYLHCGNVVSVPHNRMFNGACAVCREGKSWNRKKRSFYILDKDLIVCHNCGWSSKPLKWIKAVSGMSFNEIKKDCDSYDTINYSISHYGEESKNVFSIPSLPLDCINLGDPIQREYYKDNSYVKAALNLIIKRNFYKAVNRPRTFYISLTDKSHKNRLIIPYFDAEGNITCYQSRALDDNDDIRHKTKAGTKTLYGLDRIDVNIDSIFVCEGPSDAMFIKNGTCTSGINLKKLYTVEQEAQLQQFPFHNIIWVIDSPYLDNTAKEKTIELAKAGESVFMWPKEEGYLFKDIAQMCKERNLAGIPTQWLLDNTRRGLSAEMYIKTLF